MSGKGSLDEIPDELYPVNMPVLLVLIIYAM